MEEFIPYNESIVLTSIVNGLIATAILWTFWTPFIVFLVVPLVNAQIKDQVCELGDKFNIQTNLDMAVDSMYFSKRITKEQWETLHAYISRYTTLPESALTPEHKFIDTDPSTMSDLNFNLMISMAFAAVVIVTLSMFLVGWMINHYNLNGPHIMRFNLVMALVIVLIEMGFFGTVAMKYVPFDPPKILEALVQKIVNYLN